MLIHGGIVVLGLATSFPIYQYLGKPQIAEFVTSRENIDFANPVASSAFMLNELKKAVAKNPKSLVLRQNLTRSYLILGLYEDAQNSAARLIKLSPTEISSMLILVDVLVASNRGVFTEEAINLVRKILEIEPNNSNGLILKGLYLKQSNKPEEALVAWRNAFATLPFSSTLRSELKLLIAAEETSTNKDKGTSNRFNLSVRVSLDNSANVALKHQDTIYITTHYLDDPRIPITASRRSVRDLPFELTIDNSSIMGARKSLDKTKSIFVKVRVSASGDTKEQRSDLTTKSVPFLISKKNQIHLTLPKDFSIYEESKLAD
jgi:tetratricopeptide (TPR) repeat protein